MGFWFLLAPVCLLTLWACAAIYFDLRLVHWRTSTAVAYLVSVSAALVMFNADGRAMLVAVGASCGVLAWWLSLRPSNDRHWQPDVAETAWADIDGDIVTIHNVRNCDYRTQFDYTPRWETRPVDLSRLRGIDVFLTYWGSPWIAHPIMSFDFGEGGRIAMSVETRKEVGKEYSTVRGFFRYYELIYIISDERDVIRLRTTYRHGHDVYLYHTCATPEGARWVFLDYMLRANRLREHPEWYNALTNNCTTNIAAHVAHARCTRAPLDWRILLNGKADEMMHERGDLAGGPDFAQVKVNAHITAAARAAGDAPDFSLRIRHGRVPFDLSV
jgi:Domain of unknown function (DUF4105)